jgi:hypothetical protein
MLFLPNMLRLVVAANFVPSSPILFILLMDVIRSSETSVIQEPWPHFPQNGMFHSRLSEYLKSYIALTGWTVQWRHYVSPVRYELGFYIPEDTILHIHCRENLKSYIELTGWDV